MSATHLADIIDSDGPADPEIDDEDGKADGGLGSSHGLIHISGGAASDFGEDLTG